MSLYIDIHKRMGDFTLDVQLENRGQRLGILGASGCGKSMTLKCIAGIETPDWGRIVLNDRILFDSEQKINVSPQKRKTGYLFQNYALFPNMTVRENISIGIDKTKDRKVITDRMLSLLQIKEQEDKYPRQLSGGQQQRVALARIMAYEPEMLLLDEPFSALDSYLKEQLLQELLEVISNFKKDTLIVSHSRDELFRLSDNMAVIDGGQLITVGRTADIFKNPGNAKAARLTGCKNISKAYKISDYEICAVDWGIHLKTEEYVKEDIRYVGIRAHDICIGGEKTGDNCLGVHMAGFSEGPFEDDLIFKIANKTDSNSRIWCKVSKKYWKNTLAPGIPRNIILPKEHIMLLK